MSKDIAQRVDEVFKEREFKLNYDPSKRIYTPWYKIPFKVHFEKGINIEYVDLFNRDITILDEESKCRTLEDTAIVLLHEIGHLDILPFDLLLLYGVFTGVWNHVDDPVMLAAALGATAVGYIFLRELMVEGYNCLKYGFRKYLNLSSGRKP